MRNKKISIVIASYNEEKNILPLYNRIVKTFKDIPYDYEIIYIENGSTDNSLQIFKKLTKKDKKVKVIVFSRNYGSQMAFQAGMDYATGDGVVFMDGDLQDPPEIIPKFIEKWEEGYEVVYGIRVKRRETLFRRIAYRIFYIIFKRLAYINIPLNAGDFSLVDRRLIEIIKKMPERDRYIRGLRAFVGFKQIGVPYIREKRYAGKSTNSLWDNIRWAYKAIFSFSYKPVEFVSFLALGSFVLAVISIINYILVYFIKHDAPHGFTTLIVVILFFSSIQLLSLSIIAEYIGRIFEEVKMRPKYLIDYILDEEKNGKKKRSKVRAK